MSKQTELAGLLNSDGDVGNQALDHLNEFTDTEKAAIPNKITATPTVITAGQDWAGVSYTDPDAIGANPTAKIYPDGSVVGSTDNGNYIKYANGSLECSILKVNSVAFTSATGVSGLSRSGHQSLNFPVSFFGNVPNVQSSIIEETDRYNLWGGNTRRNLGLSAGEFVFFGALGGTTTISCKLSVKLLGKWK